MNITIARCIFLVFLSASISSFGSDSKPLGIEEALAAQEFADRVPLALSADGKWLAYTLIDPKRRLSDRALGSGVFTRTGVPSEWACGALWLANTEGGQIAQLTSDQSSSWAPSWSPDGKHLAYYSDQNGTVQLWIWDKAENKSRPASKAITRSFFGFEVPQWSADGSQLLVKLLPDGMTLSQAASLLSREKKSTQADQVSSGVTAKVFSTQSSTAKVANTGNAWTNEELADLALVDVSSGHINRLLKKEKVRGYWLSPDGAFVAASILKGERAQGSQVVVYDLALISAKTSQVRLLANDLAMPYGLNVSWSPDGHWLSYVGSTQHSERKSEPKTSECQFARVSDGNIIKPVIDGSPDFAHDYRPPAWNSSSTGVYLISGSDIWEIPAKETGARRIASLPGHQLTEFVSSGPGKLAHSKTGSIIVRTYDPVSKLRGFYSVDLTIGTVRKLFEDDRWYGRSTEGLYDMTSTPDAQVIIYGAEDAQHGRDLFVTSNQFHTSVRVTSINPQFDQHQFGNAIVVDYKDDQGNPLHGALLLPPTHRNSERYPLIVWVYGGSSGSPRINRFGLVGNGVENMQLFATRGYAVFFPDVPLTGHSPAADLVRAIMPGIRHLSEIGVIDPDRIGIMGHSYGGYSVLSLITQSTIFKAAVASAAAGDLIGMYGHLSPTGDSFGVGWCEEGQGLMGGTPWQYRQRYVDNSPFFFLDKVETPLLLIHGEADATVPAYLSGEVFVGLRRLDKEAVLALYEGEDHWEGSWSYPNQIDYLHRILIWFDNHLARSSTK